MSTETTQAQSAQPTAFSDASAGMDACGTSSAAGTANGTTQGDPIIAVGTDGILNGDGSSQTFLAVSTSSLLDRLDTGGILGGDSATLSDPLVTLNGNDVLGGFNIAGVEKSGAAEGSAFLTVNAGDALGAAIDTSSAIVGGDASHADALASVQVGDDLGVEVALAGDACDCGAADAGGLIGSDMLGLSSFDLPLDLGLVDLA